MQRLGILAIAAGTLTLALSPVTQAGTSATNAGGQFLDLDVNVSPIPGAATGLEFHSFAGNRQGAKPESSSDIKVAFPAGSKFDGASFPRCTLSTDPNGYSKCAANTQIGKGTAEGTITGDDGKPTFIAVDLKGYNGSVLDGKPTLIFLATVNGANASELDFTVDKASNGPVLDDYVTPGSAPSAIFISKFDFVTAPLVKTKKVKGKKKIVAALFTTPKKCPAAGWNFTQTDLSTGGALTSVSNSPCLRLKK